MNTADPQDLLKLVAELSAENIRLRTELAQEKATSSLYVGLWADKMSGEKEKQDDIAL